MQPFLFNVIKQHHESLRLLNHREYFLSVLINVI
jgi:hypothetical protein